MLHFKKLFLGLIRGNGLKAKLIKGAIGVGFLKGISLPLTLLSSVLLARGLGPESYGQYAFVMSVVTVLSLPIGPGVGQLIMREVASYHYRSQWGLFYGLYLWSHRRVVFGALALITLLIIGVQDIATLDPMNRWGLILLASLMLPFLGLNALRSGMLRGLGNAVYSQLPELLIRPGFLLLTVTIFLLTGNLSPATALLGQFIATMMAFLVGYFLLRRTVPAGLRNSMPAYNTSQWASAWLPFTFLAAAGIFNNHIGVLLLGWLSTDEQVAAFEVANKASLLVVFSLIVVNVVIAPHLRQAHENDDRKLLQSLAKKSARVAFMVALLVAMPMVFFYEPVISLAFGDEYVSIASSPLVILAVVQLMNVGFGSVGILLSMAGYERDTLWGQISGLIVNAIISVIIIPSYGAIGAAIGSTVGILLWNIVLTIRCGQRLQVRASVI